MIPLILAQVADKPTVGFALTKLAISIIQVVVSLGFAMLAVYSGIRIFDKFTKNIDEMAELKRGNVAVGIMLAGVILAFATVIAGGVRSLTNVVLSVGSTTIAALLVGLLGGLINLLIALGLASAAIFIAMSIFNKLTKEFDEQAEIARGNVAVAILLAAILVAVATVISSGVESVGAAISVLGNALF